MAERDKLKRERKNKKKSEYKKLRNKEKTLWEKPKKNTFKSS